jgi:hypothetical protein
VEKGDDDGRGLLAGINATSRVEDLAAFVRVLIAHVRGASAVDGKTISVQERRSFQRFLETEIAPLVLTRISKRAYVALSGRQHKVLLEQATRYSLPLRGETVDLTALVPAFHDFLAVYGRRLVGNGDPDLLMEGSSPWLEKYREEKARLARLDRLKREGSLFPREQVLQHLRAITGVLRSTGERMVRAATAADCHELMDDGLVAIVASFEALAEQRGEGSSDADESESAVEEVEHESSNGTTKRKKRRRD